MVQEGRQETDLVEPPPPVVMWWRIIFPNDLQNKLFLALSIIALPLLNLVEKVRMCPGKELGETSERPVSRVLESEVFSLDFLAL